MYYYEKDSGRQRFAFQAFEHTPIRAFLFMLTSPILIPRSFLYGCYGCPDDFPDITFIWPGGKMLPDVIASETPLAPPGRELRLSTDPKVNPSGKPLPKFFGPF